MAECVEKTSSFLPAIPLESIKDLPENEITTLAKKAGLSPENFLSVIQRAIKVRDEDAVRRSYEADILKRKIKRLASSPNAVLQDAILRRLEAHIHPFSNFLNADAIPEDEVREMIDAIESKALALLSQKEKRQLTPDDFRKVSDFFRHSALLRLNVQARAYEDQQAIGKMYIPYFHSTKALHSEKNRAVAYASHDFRNEVARRDNIQERALELKRVGRLFQDFDYQFIKGIQKLLFQYENSEALDEENSTLLTSLINAAKAYYLLGGGENRHPSPDILRSNNLPLSYANVVCRLGTVYKNINGRPSDAIGQESLGSAEKFDVDAHSQFGVWRTSRPRRQNDELGGW
jgi:hypothetical protein